MPRRSKPQEPDYDIIQALQELKQEYDNMTSKLSKLSKVNESITVNRYDNGFMVEVGGRDDDNDWKNCKILCNNEEEMLEVVREWNSMDLDS